MTQMTHRPIAGAASVNTCVFCIFAVCVCFLLTGKDHLVPNKQTILHRKRVANTDDARAFLAPAVEMRLITWRQFTALTLLAARHLPCELVLVQRTPKSTQYLTCITPQGDIEYRVGPRAEMYGARPIA